MGKRGPKPQSGKVLQMRGSRLAKQRLAEEEAADERTRKTTIEPGTVRTDPPAWLSEEAVVVYEQALEQLEATGVPFADRTALARYATTFVMWLKDKSFVEQHGSSLSTKNSRGALSLRSFPQFKNMMAASAELSRLEKELGLSVSGRAALGIGLELPNVNRNKFSDSDRDPRVKKFFSKEMW
jgi:P27 family predicted phage terminase small subunit